MSRPRDPPLTGQIVRVLIVADDRGVLHAFKRMLGEVHEVTTATSAPEALNILVTGHRFDVIFCDVWMPGEDGEGTQFNEAVQNSAPSQASRIVFVTGAVFPIVWREFS